MPKRELKRGEIVENPITDPVISTVELNKKMIPKIKDTKLKIIFTVFPIVCTEKCKYKNPPICL